MGIWGSRRKLIWEITLANGICETPVGSKRSVRPRRVVFSRRLRPRKNELQFFSARGKHPPGAIPDGDYSTYFIITNFVAVCINIYAIKPNLNTKNPRPK